MKLNDITQYIQDICQNISNVLDVDVTVVSKDLYRIAGTGIFKDKIGDKISEEAVYSNVLKTGNAHVINKDIEQSCKICSSREHCKELADICTPIKLGDENLGILGIAAFTQEQKQKLLSKDKELRDFVEGISVYARVSPEHKIRIVRAWQDKGNIVSMTGDGVNDAPALKQADIGVAMGITGSEVSKDAAALVLTDDNFATIIKAVENGRNIYQNIKNSIQFLLSGNFGAILAVLYASIAGLPVPFAPVHLLFINLLTDSLPAIALGLEPHTKDVMNEKPRPMNESILTKPFLMSIGTEGLVIGIMTMVAFMIGYGQGGSLLASTMAFGTLCMSRLVHGFNCKAAKPVIFTKRFFNNIYLIGAFFIGFVLITAVMTIPALQGMFKVVTLNMSQLLTVYGLALLNLPVIQLLKWIRNKVNCK